VELSLIMGIALALAAPFIVASQSSIIQLNEASGILQLDNSLDKVERAAKSLHTQSFPARRTVEFSSPRTAESVYNPQFTNKSALVVELRSRGISANQSILFDFNLTLHNGAELADEGNHEVVLRKNPKAVNMSVIS
jgi:hypothetical protein